MNKALNLVQLDTDAAALPTSVRPGRTNAIRNTLQLEIETGTLRPGTVLDERALAVRFEVSRTPIREALQQLAARDLVRITPRQDITVSRLSISRLREVLETVSEMETVAATLAARRVDDHLREQLQLGLDACNSAVSSNQPEQYREANRRFHQAIYQGCRNAFLVEQITSARNLVQRYRIRDFQSLAQLQRSVDEHVAIANAICNGDELSAANAMRTHLPIGSTGFSEFLANIPAHFFETTERNEDSN
jgi:DNA-binding GntR family transcriptional regulator